MKDGDNVLEVDCPHCYEKNRIKLSSAIKCKHCNKPLIGEKYTKPLISTMTAIILGIGGGVFYEKFETDRYPIAIEYSIVNSCMSSYEKPLISKYFSKKKNVCICALKETETEIDFHEYAKDKNKFLDVFGNKVGECIR